LFSIVNIYYVLRGAKEYKKNHTTKFLYDFFYFFPIIFILVYELITLVIKLIENEIRNVVNEQNAKISRNEEDI